MSKELIISATRHETRVAVIEEDQVVEIYHQRENEYSLAGSIHKGRVTRVLPGMQSAFVDIGLGRDAFLYVSDFFEDNDEYDKIVSSVEEKVLKLDRVPVAQPTAASPEGAPEDLGGAGSAVPSSEAAPAVPTAVPLGPPASAMQTPPGMERRSDRGVATAAATAGRSRRRPAEATAGGDRGDRRGGRRSRRGRGNRGGCGNGRSLPESKFYSPRQEGEGREQAPAAAPSAVEEVSSEPRVVFDMEQDDFFVLPGESLAKYKGGAEGEPEDQSAEGGAEESLHPAETCEPERESHPTLCTRRSMRTAARLRK